MYSISFIKLFRNMNFDRKFSDKFEFAINYDKAQEKKYKFDQICILRYHEVIRSYLTKFVQIRNDLKKNIMLNFS